MTFSETLISISSESVGVLYLQYLQYILYCLDCDVPNDFGLVYFDKY